MAIGPFLPIVYGPFLPIRWALTTPDRVPQSGIFPFLAGQMFITKTPIWSTTIAKARSGRERRTQNWATPRWLFKLDEEFLRSDFYIEQQTLLAFYNSMAGQFSNFYYFDPTDNAVSGAVFGVGDGTTTAFQLQRSLQPNYLSSQPNEPIYVTNGPIQVYIAGALATPSSLNQGLVTFSSPPSSGAQLTWSGSFLFWCRFDADEFDFQQDFKSIWSLKGLSFRSIKP